MADTNIGVHRRRWQTKAVAYTGEDGRHKQWRTQEKMADASSGNTGKDGRHKHWHAQKKIADTSSEVHRKMTDTGLGIQRRRWQRQEGIYTGKDGRHKQWPTQEKIAERSRGVYRKLADTSSDVQRRR